QKRDEAEVKQEAVKLLEQVGLANYAKAYPRELSGGQKQRIAIVRALIMHPEVMLFDEITASLDPEMVRGVLDIMQRLSDNEHMTMIIVTHEMNFAARIADKLLFLEYGKILEETPGKASFTKPHDKRAHELLVSMYFLVLMMAKKIFNWIMAVLFAVVVVMAGYSGITPPGINGTASGDRRN